MLTMYLFTLDCSSKEASLIPPNKAIASFSNLDDGFSSEKLLFNDAYEIDEFSNELKKL